MGATVFTIGHSNHPLENFLQLLGRHQISAVCDVRSQPYSRMNPQYNREKLRQSLLDRDIAYVFLGRELGARSEDPGCYVNGKVQYELLAKTELFRSGIARVVDGAERYRIAVMCAEKEPANCHRTVLVSRSLEAESVEVWHILADGRLEAHRDVMLRLREKLHMPEGDLFRSPDEILEDTYRAQGRRIGFEAG
jgi:uncharacterized protein (DUF488 family)